MPPDKSPNIDYVAPGLEVYEPDYAFPNMIVGNTDCVTWPFLRREIGHNWYVDRRNDRCGFINRDEAAILYNSAKLFAGKSCLEIGCHRGWSTVHIAASAGSLDAIDPVLSDQNWLQDIKASFEAAGVLDRIVLYPDVSPDAVKRIGQTQHKRWSFIFIDGNHEGAAPREDAAVAARFAADTAMIMFHDLVSPDVAAGLDYLRSRHWNTMIYQTMQIMGVAWRGEVDPICHTPDPSQFFRLPTHLTSYRISGVNAATESHPEVRRAEQALARLLDRYVSVLQRVQAGLEPAFENERARAVAAETAHASARNDFVRATARKMELDAELANERARAEAAEAELEGIRNTITYQAESISALHHQLMAINDALQHQSLLKSFFRSGLRVGRWGVRRLPLPIRVFVKNAIGHQNLPPLAGDREVEATKPPVGASLLAEAEQLAALIRGSELFDAADYAARVCDLAGLDPAVHYVLRGESAGHRPSGLFDPVFYAKIYPDVRNVPNKLVHYLQHGRAEGRGHLSITSQLLSGRSALDTGRETILLVVHDASRTGAPILAYNIARRLALEKNVVALLLGGGELVEDFKRTCVVTLEGPVIPSEIDDVVRRLIDLSPVAYAIVNSIASQAVMRPLAMLNVPVVALVHEFASYMMRGQMVSVLGWATKIVFSAEITVASARQDDPNLDCRQVHVLRQGRMDLPPRDTVALADEARLIRNRLRPDGNTKDFIVLGVGAIQIRKGVDLFLSCAKTVASLRLRRSVRFVWIGDSIEPIYQSFLDEQLARAELSDTVVFLEQVADLDPAYGLADLFFISSRLDPLPNVAIEAMLRGLPVVCFDRATGIAEVLREDPTTHLGVVPHLDISAAAQVISNLADDSEAYNKIREATRRLAARTFDMGEYVRRIDVLGHEAAEEVRQREMDIGTISADTLFDLDLSAGRDPTSRSRTEAIGEFVRSAAALGNGQTPVAHYRRPAPGFHPLIYEYENGQRYERGRVNALAHFIRSGKPAGPWMHSVITPDSHPVGGSGLRVAVHGHFYYSELAEEFIQKLNANRCQADLFLSTDSEDKAMTLRRATQKYDRGEVLIRLCPNRGRDIGPFLTLFGGNILSGGYEIVGHFHGKRTLSLDDRTIGDVWRNFLWQNLLGERHPMADIVLAHFRDNPHLGLVFPEEPNLCGWDQNLKMASDLAQRMGMALPLPTFLDFPVGTMFWARTSALKPLFDLGLRWNDYPEEPAPFDGTLLHAIERLLPLVSGHAGFGYATTHIKGVAR
jgi:glycosyltransferase involved in cell wall biosynthesis/predicted O-methyltransferase YrrM